MSSIGYLCVTGSLGWGYWDKDKSDIDIRGVYYEDTHDRLFQHSENQEIHFEPLEINLWSFDKFVNLLKKDNPSCYEWLLSPPLFEDNMFKEFRKLAKEKIYNNYRLAKHYISLAKANYKQYGNTMSEKKLVYVTRGIRSAEEVINGKLPILDMKTIVPYKIEQVLPEIERVNDIVEGNNYESENTFLSYKEIIEKYIR